MPPTQAGKDDGTKLGFGDLLDIINPLHHIPLVGTIYRSISGDAINPVMKIAGGALFGGPIGAAMSIAGVAYNSSVEAGDVKEIPVGGVDASTIANHYPFAPQPGEQLPPNHAALPAKRTLHVNTDIFGNNSNNPAAHVSFTTTQELLAGRPGQSPQSTPGLQRLLGTYSAATQQQDGTGAG